MANDPERPPVRPDADRAAAVLAPPARSGTLPIAGAAALGEGLQAPHYRYLVAKLAACRDDEATPMRNRGR
jgi:hypothetical protein